VPDTDSFCACFDQHHELMETVSLWTQRHNLWRSDGRQQGQR